MPDWVRVRQEGFGLLFYDTRSTMLTFVRSGGSLIAPAFTGPGRVVQVAPLARERRPAVSRLLRDLITRGLLLASPPD